MQAFLFRYVVQYWMLPCALRVPGIFLLCALRMRAY